MEWPAHLPLVRGGGVSERVFLLSKNTGNPTVGGLRADKEKRFTRSRLRVDSGFVSF